MATFGFVFDQSRCIGCNACQMACKDGHDLELGQFFRRVVTLEYTDERGENCAVHYSGSCNHCKNPACVVNCPAEAMYRQADGTIAVDQSKCIGCGTCAWVCPYGAPKLSSRTGRSNKCDACFGRRQEGRQPLCVEACITHCLQFVDLETLTDAEAYTDCLPWLPDPGRTNPNVRILPRR